jgi:hypothetical protein
MAILVTAILLAGIAEKAMAGLQQLKYLSLHKLDMANLSVF